MAVTQTSLNAVRTEVLSEINNNYTHIGLGDDNTEPTTSDTTLGNETYRDAFFETPTVSLTQFKAYIFLDTTENNGNDVEECGLFDAASSGTMLAHSLTNLIQKDATIELIVEYIITVSVLNA